MHQSTKARLALVTLLTLRRVSFPHPRLPELPVSDSLATGVSSQEIAPPDIAPAAEMPTGAVPAGDPTEAPDGSTYPENTPGRTDAYNALIRRVAAQHPGMVTVYDLNKVLSPDRRYSPIIDGVTVRSSDGIHISKDGGMWLRSRILPEIAALARPPRGT
jgi:lysophospholipase L1-like esterase